MPGNTRVTENAALADMRTIWVRLHSFYARKIDSLGKIALPQISFYLLLQTHQTGTQSFLKKHEKLLMPFTNISSILSSYQELQLSHHIKATNLLSEKKYQMNLQLQFFDLGTP